MFAEPDFGEMRLWDLSLDENDKEITVRAELPGFDANQIDVQFHDDVLTIRAGKESKSDGGQEFERYERSIMLPSGANVDRAEADYRNGVLELRFPRTEQSKGKKIPIRGDGSAAKQVTGETPSGGKKA